MRSILKAACVAAVMVAANTGAAQAAVVIVSGTNPNTTTTPNTLPLTLVPLGDGTYTGGSSDQIISAGTSTRNFTLNYDFVAPNDGDGSISFTTTSAVPKNALLKLSTATFNGDNVLLSTFVDATGATTYSGSFAFMDATAGDPFRLTLTGTVKRGGTLSTSVSFVETAVPEPASWALMIGGIGLMSGSLRVRRRQMRIRYAAA